jgi:hypothetical protein
VGNILFKAGDFEDSVTFYRLAVILAPKDPLGYYNLGCAYRGLKDEAKAEKTGCWPSSMIKARQRNGQASSGVNPGGLRRKTDQDG